MQKGSLLELVEEARSEFGEEAELMKAHFYNPWHSGRGKEEEPMDLGLVEKEIGPGACSIRQGFFLLI